MATIIDSDSDHRPNWEEEDQTPQKTGNWLVDHWRGALSLTQSYWINNVVGSMIFKLVDLFVQSIADSMSSVQAIMVAVVGYMAMSCTFVIWVIVGVWRSAGNHAERGGNQAWAGIAKIMCAVAAIGGIASIASSMTMLKEVSSLALGYDTIGEDATFRVSGNTLYIDGYLTIGSAKRFEEVLNGAPDVTELRLSSGGGRILEAENIAKLVSARGLTTVTNSECSSACVDVYIAGTRRLIGDSARIGFHQGDFPGLNDEDHQAMLDEQRAKMVTYRLSGPFINRAMSTAPDDMWYPTAKELIEESIVTGYDPKDLEATLISAIAAIRNMLPKRLDEVTTLVDAGRDGNSLVYIHEVDSNYESTFAQRSALLRPNIVANVCGNTETRFFIDAGGRYVYQYESIYESGQLWAEVAVDSCT